MLLVTTGSSESASIRYCCLKWYYCYSLKISYHLTQCSLDLNPNQVAVMLYLRLKLLLTVADPTALGGGEPAPPPPPLGDS